MASVLACGFTNTKAEFLSVPQDDDDPLLLLLVAEAMVERMMEAPAVQAKRTYSIIIWDAGDATSLGIGAPLCSVLAERRDDDSDMRRDRIKLWKNSHALFKTAITTLNSTTSLVMIEV